MIHVEPKAYLIAEMRLIESEAWLWLRDLGAHPEVIFGRMTGSDNEKLVELAARRCYKSFEVGLNPNVTRIREESRGYHENILKSGHGSVMEHANFTVAFEFVSRVFTHELVRHRAGCAYSQESLRFVRLTELGFWMPPEIESDPVARDIFVRTVEHLENQQKLLATHFEKAFEGDFSMKKKMTSAFRRIAPEGLSTGIVATFNSRSFRHIAKMRTDAAAEVEIRLAISKACDLVFERYPYLFQDISRTAIHEGIPECRPTYQKV